MNATTDDATEDECKIDTLPYLKKKKEKRQYNNTIIQCEQLQKKLPNVKYAEHMHLLWLSESYFFRR